jgi:cytochrome c5
MKRYVAWLIISVFAGINLLCAMSNAAENFEKGKKLYEAKCQLCHGVKGDGKGPIGDSFTPSPRDFTKPDFWKGDYRKKITDTVETGFGVMPQVILAPDQISAIIDYMSKAFKKQ